MNDRELGNIASVGVVSILIAFLFFISIMASGGCATTPKPVLLWEMCRAKCEADGAGIAAAIGMVEEPHHMACICGRRPEGV